MYKKYKNNSDEQWPDFGCEGIKVQRAHQPTSQCQGKKIGSECIKNTKIILIPVRLFCLCIPPPPPQKIIKFVNLARFCCLSQQFSIFTESKQLGVQSLTERVVVMYFFFWLVNKECIQLVGLLDKFQVGKILKINGVMLL
eukprot:TRINITY_DN7965_c0_g1_i8.p2 TRINITY_DN7965_c0_g1~~TRINITY_DN7965_c0_g1_i8.p2  ORF type:complete len:141 (-),score=11.31 TRINITY_DN7965_c0_g1_i8:477-899(-)